MLAELDTWSRGERLSRDDDVLRPSAPRALTPAAAAAARLGERRSRFRALARAALAATAAADLDADDAVGVRGLPADELRPRFDADADAEERPLFLLAGRLSFNSPSSESDDDEELLELVTSLVDEEPVEAVDAADVELVAEDDELELRRRFLDAACFLPFTCFCSCSSCLASSRCSISRWRSSASISSSCSSCRSQSFSASWLLADLDLDEAPAVLERAAADSRRFWLRLRLRFFSALVVDEVDVDDELASAMVLLLWVGRNLHLLPYEHEPLCAHCLQ